MRVLVINIPNSATNKENQDLGYITFDLEADLTPLFNWNTKQLFVFLTAEYETRDNKLNQVVLWDTIIRRVKDAKLKLENTNTKYNFWDDGNGLKGNTNVTLTLNWNVIPYVGTMPLKRATGSHSFSFPSEYASVRAQ